MKTILLIILISLGIKCQGQTNVDTQNENIILTAKLFKMAFDEIKILNNKIDEQFIPDSTFIVLYMKVDSLEKRLAWHEKMHIDDSLKAKRSLYVTDNFDIVYPIMNYDTLELVPSWVLPDNVYIPHNDTISWFDYYDCLIPPKDKRVIIWQNGRTHTYFHKVDSITFK